MATVDFSHTAADYARYRKGYPDELFRRLGGYGVGEVGQRMVDLGTGTGYLARGFARRGARVTGVDPSDALVHEAKRLDAELGVTIHYVKATAEQTGLADGICEVVTAAQCWHWFDRNAAANEAFRLIAPGGKLAIVHFDWLPIPGNVVEASENLISLHNPAQPAPHKRFGASQGVYAPWFLDVRLAGFRGLESFTFDHDLSYSHEAWRGRIRASQGVGAMMSAEELQRFDDAHAALLAKDFAAEPLIVPHRVFVLLGDRPRA